MTLVIALMALTTVGLSGAPVHEPVHARRTVFPDPATVREVANCLVGFRASGPAVTKTDGFTEPSSAPRHMASMGVAGERRTAPAAAAQRAFSRHVAYTA